MKLLLIGFLLCGITHAAQEKFAAMTYESADKQSLNYRIHIPKDLNPKKLYPLVLFFHGAGERGNDNQKQLKHGAQELLNYSEKSNQNAFIIAPQCPKNHQWVNAPWGALSHTMPPEPSTNMQLATQLLQEKIKTLPVDPQRIYITGISMGGFGTWDLIQRHPDLFAAAIPICGGGDTAQAAKLTKLPIWAFHGDKDTAVKTSRSRDMIAAIKKAGGTPNYTEYPGVAHNSWTRTYNNPEVLKWLFSQKKPD
ncbi:MAG: dienelactone hydrolase family protein [Akkermansiaceae bacterium]